MKIKNYINIILIGWYLLPSHYGDEETRLKRFQNLAIESLEQYLQVRKERLEIKFLKQIYSQAPLIKDPLIQEYTELLIYRLSEYSQVKDRYFSVLMIDDSSLNAFAAPGGIIGVNGGLFLNADNEGQFASVLSHELAHLSQRHFARNVLKAKGYWLSLGIDYGIIHCHRYDKQKSSSNCPWSCSY